MPRWRPRWLGLGPVALAGLAGLAWLLWVRLASPSGADVQAARAAFLAPVPGAVPWDPLALDIILVSHVELTPNGDHSAAPCPRGQFRLRPEAACEPALDCASIAAEVTDRQPLATGGVKELFRFVRRSSRMARGRVP